VLAVRRPLRQDREGVVDPRVLEAWSRLLSGMQSSAETMDVLLPLTGGLSRDQLNSLLSGAGVTGSRRGSRPLGMESIEQFWSLMGVVPRYRYEELEERYQALRARLEEAEVTIQRLRKIMDEKGGQPEARRLLDTWASAVGETLKMQAGIARSLSGISTPQPQKGEEPARGRKRAAPKRPRRPRSGG
jgi:hypothetical protein